MRCLGSAGKLMVCMQRRKSVQKNKTHSCGRGVRSSVSCRARFLSRSPASRRRPAARRTWSNVELTPQAEAGPRPSLEPDEGGELVAEVGEGVCEHADAAARGGEDALGVELDGGDGEGLVADGHDAAVGGLGSDAEVGGQVAAEERVVPPAHDLLGQVREDALVLVALDLDNRWLPVHRHRQDPELAAVALDHALEAKADAEDGYSALLQVLNRLRNLKVRGVPGPRRE
mmetsp:Transcript_20619/g.41818  ORF Transcript_20619/g.41818 Transcript_20619/m.41818 type:complete len:230 (+) Transcript_20619:573-1262(+)